MWQAAALASAGGGLTALVVWQLLRRLQHRASARALSRRLRAVAAQPTPAPSTVAPFPPYRSITVPVLVRLLSPWSLNLRLALWLEQAGSPMSANACVMIQLVSLLGGGLIAFWLHPPGLIALVIVLAAGCAPYAVVASQRQQRFQRLSEQLPDAIRLIVSALRAGLGLESGLDIVAAELPDPIRLEFRRLLNESLLEADASAAFRRLAKRVPMADVRLFAAAACLHREIGGNFAVLLDQLESTVRARFQLFRELKTLTAESRLTGWVLGVLPVLVGLGLLSLNPAYLRPLVEIQVGQTLLWAAVGLQLIGFAAIWWLIHPRIQ